MDIKDFKNILFAKAKDEGFSEYEIYYSERKSFSVNIYKEQIEKYQNSETSGFGFRGIYNGKMGYYYSETVDESIIPEVISEHFALQNVACKQAIGFIFPIHYQKRLSIKSTAFYFCGFTAKGAILLYYFVIVFYPLRQ